MNHRFLHRNLLDHFHQMNVIAGKPQMENLAYLCQALAFSPNSHLANLALNVPVEAQRESLMQRQRRFLSAQSFPPEFLYRPIRRHLLADWPHCEICLVMDRTDIEDRGSLLMLGASDRKRLLPLSWLMLRYGSSSANEQMKLLQNVCPDLPAGKRVHFYGDCEFRAGDVQNLCRSFDWHYQVGVKSDTYFRQSPGGWQRLAGLGLVKGERRYLADCYLSKEHDYGPLQVVADWTNEQESPRYWALDLVADRQAYRRGRKRYYIEPTFRDGKSYGFDLEGSKITDEQELDKLVYCLAMTTLWMIHVGDWLIREGMTNLVAPGNKQDYSVFRMGRDYLQRGRTMNWKVPVGFTVGGSFRPMTLPSSCQSVLERSLSAAA
jgi:hypothetical protein